MGRLAPSQYLEAVASLFLWMGVGLLLLISRIDLLRYQHGSLLCPTFFRQSPDLWGYDWDRLPISGFWFPSSTNTPSFHPHRFFGRTIAAVVNISDCSYSVCIASLPALRINIFSLGIGQFQWLIHCCNLPTSSQSQSKSLYSMNDAALGI